MRTAKQAGLSSRDPQRVARVVCYSALQLISNLFHMCAVSADRLLSCDFCTEVMGLTVTTLPSAGALVSDSVRLAVALLRPAALASLLLALCRCTM